MRTQEIDALVAALREERDRRYLSMRGMARMLGYSTGQLSMVLNGKRRPSMRFMEAAVAAFPAVRRRLRESLEDDDAQQRPNPSPLDTPRRPRLQ